MPTGVDDVRRLCIQWYVGGSLTRKGDRMILYHVTTRERFYGITRSGIDPAYSKGKLQASWFVDARKLHWAVLHVRRRHGSHLRDIHILQVRIESGEVKRAPVAGLYYREQLTTVDRIEKILRVDDIDVSPLGDE